MKTYLPALLLGIWGQLGLHAEARYTVVPVYPPPEVDPLGFGTSIGTFGINERGDVVGEYHYFDGDGSGRQYRKAFLAFGGTNAVELAWEGRVVTSAVAGW